MKLLMGRAQVWLAVGALALLAPAASAFTISAPVISNNTTQALSGPSADRAATNGAQVLASGGTSFDTRFWATAAADRGVAFSGGTASATVNMNYTITFSVTAAFGLPYQLDVSTSLLGALTAIDDAAGLSAGGTSLVDPVNASLTGGVLDSGSLALPGTNSIGGTSGTNNVPISRAGSAVILGTGTGAAQLYTFTFTGLFRATSPQNVAGGDEHAVRFGLATGTGGLLSGATADDYPGPGGRDGLADGHFVSLTGTVIPEPGTLVLLGSGLAGLAIRGRRRAA